MKLNSGTITAGVAVLAIVIALAGMVYQQGRLVNRVDALSQEVDALSADMDQLMGQVGELKVAGGTEHGGHRPAGDRRAGQHDGHSATRDLPGNI